MLGVTRGFLKKYYSKFAVRQTPTLFTVGTGNERENNLIYTNDKDTPILVCAKSIGTTSNNISIYVDNVMFDNFAIDGASSICHICVTAIVPPGSEYYVSTTKNLTFWSELR